MTIHVAINGYGRLGRNILRALYEGDRTDEIKIVAINDLGSIEALAHLTRYDSTHGRFNAEVTTAGDTLIINGDPILVTSQRNPTQLPWEKLKIDVVYECTGFFTERAALEGHLAAGAQKVLLSAPGKEVDATIVYGVNHKTLTPKDRIVSNASCTTNCLAVLAKPLQEKLGIVSGVMNTIHAYTKDQVLLDGFHEDLRRARSATQSMIPTKTGAAVSVGLVIPELQGKLDGFAIRVPTANVSLVDFTFKAKRETSCEEIDRILTEAAQGALNGLLIINREPLVSCDFNHHAGSAIFDATQTKVFGDLVKVLAWYDNEWGFSNRMLDVSLAMMGK